MRNLSYLFTVVVFFAFTACGTYGGEKASSDEASEVAVCAVTGEPCLDDHSCCAIKEEHVDHDHSDSTHHEHMHDHEGHNHE